MDKKHIEDSTLDKMEKGTMNANNNNDVLVFKQYQYINGMWQEHNINKTESSIRVACCIM